MQVLFSLGMPLGRRGTFWWEVTVPWPGGKLLGWCCVHYVGRLRAWKLGAAEAYHLCPFVNLSPSICALWKFKQKSDNQGSTAIINILVGGLRSEAKEQTSDGGSNITASWMQDSVQTWLKHVSCIAVYVGAALWWNRVVTSSWRLSPAHICCSSSPLKPSHYSKFCCDNWSANRLC